MIPASGEEEEGMVNALIPYWDMANHDQGQVSTDFDPVTNTSLCYAHKKFAKGEQLTIFYGVRANCDLLVHNGFVFPDNQVQIIFQITLYGRLCLTYSLFQLHFN